jgi:hypothetical protein
MPALLTDRVPRSALPRGQALHQLMGGLFFCQLKDTWPPWQVHLCKRPCRRAALAAEMGQSTKSLRDNPLRGGLRQAQ